MTTSIVPFLDACFPFVCVETYDESRVVRELQRSDRRVFIFSASGLLTRPGSTEPERISGGWGSVFSIFAMEDNAVLLVRDLQHVVNNPPVYRAILDSADELKARGSCIVALSPAWKLPNELRHFGPVVQQELPTREELQEPLQAVAESAGAAVAADKLESLLEAAAGLTIAEAENAFALAIIECGELCPRVVEREKMRLLGTTGFLSVEQPKPITDLGGLGNLKSYIQDEVSPCARDTQLQTRGVILAGLPGNGKSLGAKVFASILGRPLVRLDVGACKGSLVGQSEANIRQATSLVEAIAPCVLWIDEIEKGVAGANGSGASDGGTSLGMVGHLLTWLQEHNKAILTIATCNDYQALPTELTRAGRFDERFVIDLPTLGEREAIAAIHLGRMGCDVGYAEEVAAKTDKWTGAEIEQLVKSAARLSGRNITSEHIDKARGGVRPLSDTAKDRVAAFREWSINALRLANDPAEPVTEKPRRKLVRA